MQTIQYFVTKPEVQAVRDMGHFLMTTQWFADPKDPFHRSPSVMTYDHETNQFVTQGKDHPNHTPGSNLNVQNSQSWRRVNVFLASAPAIAILPA